MPLTLPAAEVAVIGGGIVGAGLIDGLPTTVDLAPFSPTTFRFAT